jgi:molybdopterin molybdotransferase
VNSGGATAERLPNDRPALTIEAAQAAVLRRARPVPVETWRLDAAAGCALAHDVFATVTLPPWNNAAMDGVAVRAQDVLGASSDAPRALRVIGSIAAGGTNAFTVSAGTAVRIMTGAPLPDGADAVIRVEDTRVPEGASGGGEQVLIVDDRDAQTATRNVRPRGEDITDGALVARAGDTLSPALLGVLASIGCATVDVHRRPRVVIAPSGDELLPVEAIDDVRAGRGIIGSSTFALEALLRATGADVRVLPALPDDPELLRDALGRALEDDCDLLVTTGGVSMGVHDHLRDVIVALGGRIDVHRVRVRPGGPTSAGHVLGTPWIGLPGNPVSTLVMAELLARPAIRALGGHARVLPQRVPVRLAHDVAAAAPLRFFLRASLHVTADGTLNAALTGRQGSNLLTSMARADALLEIDGPRDQVPAGTVVPALLLDHALLRSASAATASAETQT